MMMRVLLFLILVGLVTSCSRIGLGLKYAEYSAKSDVKELFDFSGDKSDKADQQLDDFAANFRKDFLPEVEKILTSVRIQIAQLPADKIKIELKPYYLKILETYNATMQKYEPAQNEFVNLIGKKEFETLVQEYEKKMNKDKEKYKNPGKRDKKIEHRFTDAFDYLLGSLSDSQEKMIEDHFKAHKFPAELWAKNKDRNLQQIKDTQGKNAELKKLVNTHLKRPNPAELPEYRAQLNFYIDGLIQLSEQLIETSTQKQRETLAERLSIADAL